MENQQLTIFDYQPPVLDLDFPSFSSLEPSVVKKTPRSYQESAIFALLDALEQGRHPVCNMPTGSGKSIVIAELCRRLSGRILVATHRKELLEQNEGTLLEIGEQDTGIYSAGLDRRDTDARVIFGGVQSIYRRMDELGPFDYILIDENHLVPPKNKESMYKTVLEACPHAKRVGFSATPYRLGEGTTWEGSEAWFDTLAVDITISELIPDYLSRLIGVETAVELDMSHVRTKAGEFVTSDLSQVMTEEKIVKLALDEIMELTIDRKHWLVFCVDRAHTELIRDELRMRGVNAQMILGNTPSDERDQLIKNFRRGGFRALVSCETLTTGFDVALVDCVILLRPSQSKGLIVQMLGRGTRLSPKTGKENCLVLDLAGNLARHVPLEGIPEVLKSPTKAEADEAKEAARRRLQAERETKHGFHAARGIDPMTGKPLDGMIHHLRVDRVSYMVKPSRKFPTCHNFMVSYKCRDEWGLTRWVSQWLCIEYPGRVRTYAKPWFDRRGVPMPEKSEEAKRVSRHYPRPTEIVVRKDGDWDRILIEYFDE